MPRAPSPPAVGGGFGGSGEQGVAELRPQVLLWELGGAGPLASRPPSPGASSGVWFPFARRREQVGNRTGYGLRTQKLTNSSSREVTGLSCTPLPPFSPWPVPGSAWFWVLLKPDLKQEVCFMLYFSLQDTFLAKTTLRSGVAVPRG